MKIRKYILCFLLIVATSFALHAQAINNQNLLQAQNLFNEGNILLKTEPEKAIPLLKKAQFILKNQKKISSEIDCILSLAEVHLRISDYEISYSLLTNAASLALEHNLPNQLLMSFASLGRVSTYMDETERALSYFNDGYDLAKQLKLTNQEYFFKSISAYTKITYKNDYSQSNFNDIHAAFLAFSSMSSDTLLMMPILNFYAEALYKIKKNVESAGFYYQKCISLTESINDKYRFCIYSNNFADLILNTGDVERAEKIFENSLSIGEKINSKLLIYNGHKNLSNCAETRMDFKKALYHYKKYEEVKNQVLNENLLRKTRNLHSLYLLEKKARENDKIKNDQDITKKDSESKIKSYQIFSFIVFLILVFFLILFYINRTRLNESLGQTIIINEQNQKLQELNTNLWKQTKSAENARSEAEKAIRSKVDFFSMITHEIRTPLNAVIGTVQLLEEEKPAAHQLKSFSILKFSSINLLNLINDILDFNKIEAQKVEIENKPFQLHHLLVNIKNSLQMSADEKGIELTLRIDKNIPACFIGDKQRLGQIFYNLMANSLKFTEKGSIEVEIRYYQNQPTYNIIAGVKDTGIGIPKDRQEAIFEFFSQADSETSKKFGGFGLGLTITRNLLQMMGSNIEVESTENKGSRFFFKLNLPVYDAPIEESTSAQREVNDHDKLTGKLLFVEDVEFNRVVAERFFRKWGLQFDTAVNALEAIEFASLNHYDLILMDLQLPDMSGFKTAESIRKRSLNMNTTILAMTASSYGEVKDDIEESGMNGYLPKPFVAGELRQILKSWLAKIKTTS